MTNDWGLKYSYGNIWVLYWRGCVVHYHLNTDEWHIISTVYSFYDFLQSTTLVTQAFHLMSFTFYLLSVSAGFCEAREKASACASSRRWCVSGARLRSSRHEYRASAGRTDRCHLRHCSHSHRTLSSCRRRLLRPPRWHQHRAQKNPKSKEAIWTIATIKVECVINMMWTTTLTD